MNELINKRIELEQEIEETQIKVSRLLNYGNVSVENWEEATRRLNVRMRLTKALDEINDVIKDVKANNKPDFG